jgi:glucose-1-phosphate adenylyltransferase
MDNSVVAIILAGGRGKRMDLLCHVRPKPVLPFAGKLHVIDFSLSNCINSQIQDVAVLVDYQREYMARYLRKWARDNVNLSEITILQPKIGSYAGTANAVYQNLSFLNTSTADQVLILAGDHVYRMDYRKMLAFHEKTRAAVTVGVVKIPIEEAYRFGTVLVDSENKILEFREKLSQPLSTLASMGIYIFNKDVLIDYLSEDAGVQNSSHDFGYSILPSVVKSEKVMAFEFTGYWQDIGTVAAYFLSNMELLGSHPRFSLDGRWPVMSDRKALPIPEKSQDGKIVNSIISPGCVIQGLVENSVLSPGVYVEEQATVRNSVVMSNTRIGYHSVIEQSILDEGVQLAKFCYIGFGESLMQSDSEITVLGKNVVVHEATGIGRNCKIFPRVNLSNYKGILIPSGTTVRSGAINVHT